MKQINKEASRRELVSWVLYDFANSSFTTFIVTVGYSVYFKSYVASNREYGDFLWGLAVSLSMAFVALSSPVLGAIADFSGSKKLFLAIYSWICIAFTCLLFFIEKGSNIAGMAVFAVANVGFEGAYAFYNGFLPEIATREKMGRISGYGWAVGYLGGLLSLAIVYPLIKGGLAPGNIMNFRLSFPVIGLFFFIFSIPVLVFLKERAEKRRGLSLTAYVSEGFRRLGHTFRILGSYRELLRFLVAYFIYNDAICTVIAFSSIFAVDTLKFTLQEVMIFFISIQTTSFIGAFAFGYLLDRIGAKKTIMITLLIWIGVVTGVYFTETKFAYYVVGFIAGIAIGSSQSASRTMLGLMTPPEKSAEFFGFYEFCGKASGIIGPVLFGAVSSFTGNQRNGILVILGLFVTGMFLMRKVSDVRAN